jgi:hypothetical protein
VQEVPHVQRCGIAFVAGGLTDTYSLAYFRPTIPIVVSASRFAIAEIACNEGKATLGPWQVNGDVPQSWLAELLEEGHSDLGVEADPPPVDEVSNADFQDLADKHPGQLAEFQDSSEIHTQLGDLIADQMHNGADGNPITIFWALESVLLSIVKDLGSPTGVGQCARFLKDHPDKFPMFSTVPDQVPSAQRARSYVETLQRFSCEKRGVGHTSFAIFLAFMNMYMRVGSQAIGALELTDRIETWDPEQQARLRQVGLRSIFESDNEQGQVVYVLSADRYPIGVIGWRNAVGDFFVSRMATCREGDFAAAVESIKQSGAELILGSEAKELICKMEQVKGVAPRADKSRKLG